MYSNNYVDKMILDKAAVPTAYQSVRQGTANAV